MSSVRPRSPSERKSTPNSYWPSQAIPMIPPQTNAQQDREARGNKHPTQPSPPRTAARHNTVPSYPVQHNFMMPVTRFPIYPVAQKMSQRYEGLTSLDTMIPPTRGGGPRMKRILPPFSPISRLLHLRAQYPNIPSASRGKKKTTAIATLLPWNKLWARATASSFPFLFHRSYSPGQLVNYSGARLAWRRDWTGVDDRGTTSHTKSLRMHTSRFQFLSPPSASFSGRRASMTSR